MATKKTITVVDSNRTVALGSNVGYQQWLDREGVQSLVDSEGCEIVEYGLLVDGGEYTLGPPQQQQQQQNQFQLPAATVAGLNDFVSDFVAKKRTIVLSKATSSARNECLDMIKLHEIGASWPTKPTDLPEFPGFEWLSGDEDCPENRTAYMKHLENHLKLPGMYSLADVQPISTLLNVVLPGRDDQSRKVSGTTDVVLAKSTNIENDAIRNNVEALIELKKPRNMRKKDHTPQTVIEHLAASFLNEWHGIFSVLTDLENSWTFYWYAEAENGPGVALHKLKLKPEAEAARLAKYILENFNNEARRETLPTQFLDRLSFAAVLEKIGGSDSDKRPRMDPSGGGEGGSRDPRAMGGHSKTFGSEDSPSGPGGSSGGAEPPSERGGGGGSGDGDGDGNTQNNMARVLRRFAPNSSSDVGNELDLLDMVDETEQYAIVRSFAEKHIAPYMTGQYP